MVLLAFGLSVLTLNVDRRIDQGTVSTLPFVFQDGVEGARGLLSSMATSLITVTGVIFSVTMVAFTLASQQFTPRLLRNFMRDRGSQRVLGLFIATFTFCLCVLRVVGGPSGDFIPRLSVSFAFALTLGCVGGLVFFVHHAAALIQAQSIIAGAGRALGRAIEQLYPHGAGEPGDEEESPAFPPDEPGAGADVTAPRSDYIEAIDVEGLIDLAAEFDFVLRVEVRPGNFVGKGEVLAGIYPAEAAQGDFRERIAKAFVLGPQRTQTQDAEFILMELVEMAVRALSPGVNDPATAVQCVDRLGAALAEVASRPLPSAARYRDGQLRVVVKHLRFKELSDAAFTPIRQYGRGSAAVINRLLEAVARAGRVALREQDRDDLRLQASVIERSSREYLPEEVDRRQIQEKYRAALAILDRPQANLRQRG